ncbi:radical SAM family heme chaperone HemW [Natroniella sulfidigena]|uniref:radical SAM family heme chaperone HemW n=1 Tax=Natroniella sulfidigena TaxID=723921 RepID=UPI00200B34ED|nr:radical SAM family heme chaperone HemW [Natroniella sulfidigena]MCK8815915.1 radical SAM family heme chaperone HemW [Natroniella sulfidigena]
MNKFGLYIHIPFCSSKCYYCDFNSVEFKESLLASFLQALEQEIKLIAAKYTPVIRSIFIGGGTPSMLSGQQLVTLLKQCQEEFDCQAGIEITVEANPETVTAQKLKLLKEAGVNRLSFGVQSFDDQLLQKLGRRHTSQEAIRAFKLARELGFSNLNFDLMFALPGQSLRDWEKTLIQACQLGPDHLATYNLKIEEGTIFAQQLQQGKIDYCEEELDLAMYQKTVQLLANEGYQQYEISNFARPGAESIHNQIYWKNEPYLALGPGAHFCDAQGRGYNLADIDQYCQQLAQGQLSWADYQRLSQAEKIEESMILGLRLKEGILLDQFEKKYQTSIFDLYQDELDDLLGQQLIEIKADRMKLTEQGFLLANQVLANFILT